MANDGAVANFGVDNIPRPRGRPAVHAISADMAEGEGAMSATLVKRCLFSIYGCALREKGRLPARKALPPGREFSALRHGPAAVLCLTSARFLTAEFGAPG